MSWESFDVGAMQAQRQGQNVSFLTVLDDRRFRMGLLHVPRSTGTGLVVHRLNAVYHVVSGAATIATDTLAHSGTKLAGESEWTWVSCPPRIGKRATGLGVTVAAEEAQSFAGIPLEGARIAIQGYYPPVP